MDIWRVHSFSHKRFRSSRIHRNVLSPKCCQYTARIGGYLFKRRIAVDGANAEQAQGGMMGGEEDGKCVLNVQSAMIMLRRAGGPRASWPEWCQVCKLCQGSSSGWCTMLLSNYTWVTVQPHGCLVANTMRLVGHIVGRWICKE